MRTDERPVRVLLLSDLDEPLGPSATGSAAVLAWDIAASLALDAETVGGLSVDLVARRGSAPVLPLITAEPDELAPRPTTASGREARQDAAYMQMVLAGLFSDYDVIHCLIPLVSPLQVLAAMGQRICLTLTFGPTHLAARLARLLPPERLRPVGLGTQGPDPLRAIPPPVDLARYRLEASTGGDYLVWDGTGGHAAHAVASAAAGQAGLDLRVLPSPGRLANVDEPIDDLAGVVASAAAMLHLPYPPEPVDVVWPLRALATGAPVISWPDPSLERYCEEKGIVAFLPVGAIPSAELVRGLDHSTATRSRRRQAVLAWSGYRQVASRIRAVHRDMLEPN